jgi:hypothetical protein
MRQALQGAEHLRCGGDQAGVGFRLFCVTFPKRLDAQIIYRADMLARRCAGGINVKLSVRQTVAQIKPGSRGVHLRFSSE